MPSVSTATTETSARDRHLFGPGPKRILALDGGGVRGILSIAFLERFEALLSAELGRPARLHEHFDLIGGTSTGALIGAALALGLSAVEVRDFYLNLAPKIFKRSRWRLFGVQAKFDAAVLRAEVDRVLTGRTLDSLDLKTGLAIIAKRMDTGSAWVICNNPRSRYWESPADGSFIGNRHMSLASIIRASTAAPTFFAPEPVEIVAGEPPGLFVDGGVTAYKNPSIQLILMALVDAYGLGWQSGGDRLQLVSVGTGDYRDRMAPKHNQRMTAIGVAIRALRGTLADTATSALTLLHWLSGTESLWPINSEIGTLAGTRAPGGAPLFAFNRYDVQLEAGWLNSELGLSLTPAEVEPLRRLDEPLSVPTLYEIGKRAAERYVLPEHVRALAAKA